MTRKKKPMADRLRDFDERGPPPSGGWPEDQRGDAWESPRIPGPQIAAPPGPGPSVLIFPDPIPASRLKAGEKAPWLWQGYLSRGDVTLFSALWKAGKTTLLSHLLAAIGDEQAFCGLQLQRSQVLYVTEESESRWAARRDEIRFGDHVEFLVRPFRGKPTWDHWTAFLAHLDGVLVKRPADLVIFDTIANLWPVKDENDASQVQTALMPLRGLPNETALMLVHHNRKGDGQEATATRGSGALPAFVDTIVELRRFDAGDRRDRRRVLTGYGRWDDTPDELVVELGESGYVPQGDRHHSVLRDIRSILDQILPTEAPGLSLEGIRDAWPEDAFPRKQRLLETLGRGVDEGLWIREGEGKRGSPFTFWTPPRVP